MALRYVVEDARDLGELIGNTEDGGGIGVPSGARNLFIRDQSLVGTLNSVLKPNLVNTVLGQYARRHYNFPGATGEPNLDVGLVPVPIPNSPTATFGLPRTMFNPRQMQFSLKFSF